MKIYRGLLRNVLNPKMANSLINSILGQSLKTFKNTKPGTEIFSTNFQNLKSLLDTLTAEHVNLDSRLLEDSTWSSPRKAPMTYIQLYQDNYVNISIFVLKPGSKLPLHDHPHMHGLLKVIAGKVKISNYSIRSGVKQEILAERHTDKIVDQTSESCVLKPLECNLHEVESVGGASAFLDVLAPPYDVLVPEFGERKCSYYKVVQEIDNGLFYLREISEPSWFWSDQELYKGPKLETTEL